MTPEHYERVRAIFLAAREKPNDERAAYLQEVCADDEGMRAEVRSLLANAEAGDTFLQTPVLGAAFAVGRPESLAAAGAADRLATAAAQRASGPRTHGAPPERVGQYRILDVLGEGGMGVVYRAQQERPRRIVALKVIRPGAESRETLKRFEHEGQVLGRLQHPGIAQVFEAGTADTAYGRQPFFAMELIEGEPLTAYAAAHNLDVRARLELLAKVCDAAHHAHQKGVIHRDLKPGNILVDAGGQPKILDFGVARVTDADIRTTTLQTQVGQIIGTMAYMSPEQVAGDPGELDTRSDVYALGVILYELLTARVPLDVSGQTIAQAARTITEQEPPTLSSISRSLRGDLDTIVAKALEKDKNRRYQSASDLGADLRRYLSDEPITARPVTTFYQLRKFARRNRVLVAGLLGVVAALAVGTVVSTSLAIWALGAEELAQHRFEQAEDARQLAEQRRREATTEATRAMAFRDFLVGMLDHINPDVALGRDRTLLKIALDAAAEDIQTELADYPEVQAGIHHVVGNVYRNLSLYDQAEQHLQAAYDLRVEHLGAEHLETLASLGALAQVRWDQGRLDDAEGMYRRLVASYSRVLGETHRDTLVARYSLAGVIKEDGRLDEAEAELRAVLTLMQDNLDETDDALLDAMNGLAALAIEHGAHLEEAEGLLRSVVRARTDAQGRLHPRRVRALRNLAKVVKDRGELAEAERLTREALELGIEVFGENHHDIIQTRINLAGLLRERGQLDEAESVARTALAQATDVLGPEHPDTIKAVSHLGVILRLAERLDEARPYLEQAVALSEKVHGRADSRTLNSLSSLAGLLYMQQDLEEAEKIMRRVVDGLRELHGERSFQTLAAMNNLGMLLVELGKLDEAEQTLQTVIRLTDESAPPGHWFRWVVRLSYGDCLAHMERFEEAEELLLACHANLERMLGPDHHRTRDSMQKLAALYDAWGKPEEAAKYQEPATTQPAQPDSQAP